MFNKINPFLHKFDKYCAFFIAYQSISPISSAFTASLSLQVREGSFYFESNLVVKRHQKSTNVLTTDIEEQRFSIGAAPPKTVEYQDIFQF